MRIRQITSITILLLLAATASNLVWALTPTSSMELPLTQGEQAARLWRIASAEVARKLYPTFGRDDRTKVLLPAQLSPPVD